MTSPFRTHRDKVLGYYGTAGWLRRVVLALWSGSAQPVGLSNLCGVDEDHFNAFIEMVTHYRRVGENDPALQQLVQDIEARVQEEAAAAEREKHFEAWRNDAASELRRLGKPADLVDDRYNWFAARFDAGDTPEVAALECQPLPMPSD